MGFFGFGDESFSIDDFSKYFQGGAKPYMFLWTPNTTFLKNDYRYLVKATSVPSTTIEEIVVEYQQINFKYGGKKTFEDWTVTMVVDSNAEIRVKLEEWSNKIHNISSSDGFRHGYFNDYKADEEFRMLGNDWEDLLVVKLYDAWPKSIGQITLDYSVQDFAQFDVTFSYMYHEIKEYFY
jgi:hypothetical protein